MPYLRRAGMLPLARVVCAGLPTMDAPLLIDPPPPHPNLEVRTRAFYGAHNALPVEFWPPCHHGDDAVVQVYEHFGDAGRRFFHCPYYEVFIYFHLSMQIYDEMLTSNSF